MSNQLSFDTTRINSIDTEYNFAVYNPDLIFDNDARYLKRHIRDVTIHRVESTSYGGKTPKPHPVFYRVYASVYYENENGDLDVPYMLKEFGTDRRDAERYKKSIMKSLIGHGGWHLDSTTGEVLWSEAQRLGQEKAMMDALGIPEVESSDPPAVTDDDFPF